MNESEKDIFQLIQWAVFEPVFMSLGFPPPKTAENAKETSQSIIISKIRSGDLIYSGVILKGKYNAAISKAAQDLGLVWNSAQKSYAGILPANAIIAANIANKARIDNLKRLEFAINSIPERTKDILNNVKLQAPTIAGRTEKIKLGIEKIKPEDLDIFANGYNDGIKRAFANYAEKETETLRSIAQLGTFDNLSVKEIAKKYIQRYDVSKEKAKFWARQETGLLSAGIENKAMAELGIRYYRWHAVGDNRSRSDHMELDGHIFNADNPPITNYSETLEGKPARRGNPRSDYNCRCNAIWLTDREVDEARKKGLLPA